MVGPVDVGITGSSGGGGVSGVTKNGGGDGAGGVDLLVAGGGGVVNVVGTSSDLKLRLGKFEIMLLTVKYRVIVSI